MNQLQEKSGMPSENTSLVRGAVAALQDLETLREYANTRCLTPCSHLASRERIGVMARFEFEVVMIASVYFTSGR